MTLTPNEADAAARFLALFSYVLAGILWIGEQTRIASAVAILGGILTTVIELWSIYQRVYSGASE